MTDRPAKSRTSAPQVREQILAFLRDYIAEHGYAPTDTEIGQHVDRSQQAVSGHINTLISQGRLVVHGKRRALTILPDPLPEEGPE